MRVRKSVKNKMHRINAVKRRLRSCMVAEKNSEKARIAFKKPPYKKWSNKPIDTILNSISDMDTSRLLVPVIAVYEHPEDYPACYVARVFDVDIPTNVIIVKDSLEEIQRDIMTHTGKEFFMRDKEDAPELIGKWV